MLKGEDERRLSRRSASPPSKVALLTGRLLSKAHSDLTPTSGPPGRRTGGTFRPLQSPRVVQRALMGNVIRGKRDQPKEHKIQVEVEVTKPGARPSKTKETLTATSKTSGSGRKESGGKKTPSRAPKSVKISSTVSVQNGQPSKPPRKTKEGKRKEKGVATSTRHALCVASPPAAPVSPKPQERDKKSRSPTPIGTKRSPHLGRSLMDSISKTVGTLKKEKGTAKKPETEGKLPPYTVTQKPLAPPAESTPTRRNITKDSVIFASAPSLCSLAPYLVETKRVSESVFLRGRSPSPAPRPTKTSLMRHIIARDPGAAPSFKDSSFKSSENVATLESETLKASLSTSDLAGVKPRQKRRRSVSCLNLRDYAQYVLALRYSHQPQSTRFSRLQRLYSSLERLYELERSASSLYDTTVLPASKKNDFDAWWKWRNRIRIEEEAENLSRELLQAQRDREFFFRPKTPPTWRPTDDAHLRFKKWSVEELKAFLLAEGRKSRDGWNLDLYKTKWRGVTVKEVALSLEVNELYSAEKRNQESKGVSTLRRAFSMSSTLSEEQREGIKRRIGHFITAAKERGLAGTTRNVRPAGRPAVLTPMGFTLSSDPKKAESMQPPSVTGLSEKKKREISHKLSEEVKERRIKETQGAPYKLPISTQMVLRKAESFSSPRTSSPFYSVYCKNDVNNRIKAFERQSTREGKPDKPRIVHAVAPTPSQSAKSVEGKGLSSGPSSLPLPPFRSQSPHLRSPSPPRSLSPSRHAVFQGKEYVSHINIISKLAALLLKRNTHLRSLVTREVLERDRLERLRAMNCGEVERLREFFEERQTLEDLRDLGIKSPEVNLLRCLFCSDSNLAKLTEKLDPDHKRRCASAGGTVQVKRAAPDRSSPTPTGKQQTSTVYLNTRSRRPIYQPSSTPNICQPTLTAHCYLGGRDSLEGLESPELYDYGGSGYDSLPLSHTYSSPNQRSPDPPAGVQRRLLSERTRPSGSALTYINYDPAIHQPKYRYVPQPPVLPPQIPSYQSSLKRAESYHGGVRRVGVTSPPYYGQQGYPHSVASSYARVVKAPRRKGQVPRGNVAPQETPV